MLDVGKAEPVGALGYFGNPPKSLGLLQGLVRSINVIPIRTIFLPGEKRLPLAAKSTELTDFSRRKGKVSRKSQKNKEQNYGVRLHIACQQEFRDG